MVTLNWNWVNREQMTTGQILNILGIFTTVFSAGMGLLVLYVIPSSCSWLLNLELGILTLLFLGGIGVFIAGRVLMRRERRSIG
ncbi:MAG: hypothetical protein HYX83_01255 [Chloroflexi bacterium]|nr:hypothetical protein [Chloroflexota bacterium]